MNYFDYDSRAYAVCLSNVRIGKTPNTAASITGAPTMLGLLATVTVVLGTATTANANPIVTPVSSSFYAESKINSIMDIESPSQGATLNPLDVSTFMSGGQMSLSTIGSAGWSSPSSLTVDLDIARPDAAVNGTSLGFYGNGRFDYTFNVSADTTVTVDYDAVGTSTSDGGVNGGIPAGNIVRWYAMSGYDILIVNEDFLELNYPNHTNPVTHSPVEHQGAVVFNILAGTHTVRIQSTQSATGNFPGDRATVGAFAITIGPDTLPGDGNGDGWVNGLDYLLWAGAFGTHPGADCDISDGDYNDDGWVDGLDYLVWAGNFGTHDGVVVPEPGACALLVVGTTFLMSRRRRS